MTRWGTVAMLLGLGFVGCIGPAETSNGGASDIEFGPTGDVTVVGDGATGTDAAQGDASDAGSDSDGSDATDDTWTDTGDLEPPCITPGTGADGVAVTSRAAYLGAREDGVWRWLGMAYAAPPVDDLRWQPPAAPVCRELPVEASTWPPPCAQPSVNSAGEAVTLGSEDCLYLNVWNPDLATPPKPVVVFLHGGGHVSGSTSATTSATAAGTPTRLYDGARLAKAAAGEVVVVTVQYRLGALGYLNLPELDAADPRGVSGNYGLLDQVAALKWVQANISAFGGDPARVTLIGQSSGASDVCLLLTMPSAAGLFHRAVMMSGMCSAATVEQGRQASHEFKITRPCDGPPSVALECLRGLSIDELVRDTAVPDGQGRVQGNGLRPVIDVETVPQDPLMAIVSGQNTDLPVVIGTNAHETAGAVPFELTPADLSGLFEGADDATRLTLESLYPAGDGGATLIDSFVRATTDRRFVCPARHLAQRLDNGNESSVFRYHFRGSLPGPGPGPAFHGLDMLYLFGVIGSGYDIPDDDPAHQLEATMAQHVAQFTVNGAPAAPNIWPAWDSAEQHVDIGPTLTIGTGLGADACLAWQALLE